MYEELNKYVRGEKKLNIISLYKVSRMIETMALNEIRNMGFSEPEYKLYAVVKDNWGYDTCSFGEQIVKDKKIIVKLNKRLVDGLDCATTQEDVKQYDVLDKQSYSRIDLFLTLFHELEHVHQAKMYETNTVDNVELYKDRALSMYFDSIDSTKSYYGANYDVTTEEILANLKAIEKTIQYFNKYNIELTKEELEIFKLRTEKFKALLANKQRKNPIDGKMYDLDELYAIASQDQKHVMGDLDLLEGKPRK